jgi:hypothetical protein
MAANRATQSNPNAQALFGAYNERGGWFDEDQGGDLKTHWYFT